MGMQEEEERKVRYAAAEGHFNAYSCEERQLSILSPCFTRGAKQWGADSLEGATGPSG